MRGGLNSTNSAMKHILKLLLYLSCICSVYSATVIQSFSNNSVGSLLDGDSTILSTNPFFSAHDLAGATQLEIQLTLTGDAHQFITSTTGFGSNHPAESLTQVSFGHVNTSSALFIDTLSLQLVSLDENPVINGFASGDTSSLYAPNPMSYTATWSTSDTSLINTISGGSYDFQAELDHQLGADAAFNQLLGGATYSNNRLQDVSFQVDYRLNTTSMPEPSTSLLLGGSLMSLLFRRKR